MLRSISVQKNITPEVSPDPSPKRLQNTKKADFIYFKNDSKLDGDKLSLQSIRESFHNLSEEKRRLSLLVEIAKQEVTQLQEKLHHNVKSGILSLSIKKLVDVSIPQERFISQNKNSFQSKDISDKLDDIRFFEIYRAEGIKEMMDNFNINCDKGGFNPEK